MPDKNDNGTTTKFVTAAILSNFSAHKPAINPREDRKHEPSVANVIHKKCYKGTFIKINETKMEKKPTTKPLVIPPKIIAKVTSPGDRGGYKISTIFP